MHESGVNQWRRERDKTIERINGGRTITKTLKNNTEFHFNFVK